MAVPRDPLAPQGPFEPIVPRDPNADTILSETERGEDPLREDYVNAEMAGEDRPLTGDEKDAARHDPGRQPRTYAPASERVPKQPNPGDARVIEAGLDKPTSGAYYLGDTNVAQMSDDQLSEVRSTYLGFIFQSYNLLPQYTVVENIEVPLLYQGCRLTAQTRDRCVELADLVGLGDRLDHRPMQLSGGQQQRVAIARSLINDPYIILADEATGNLDSVTSEEIMTMLGRLNDAGKTIIMVTHEDDIAEHAKRIIRMRDGVIIEDGPSPRMLAAAHGNVAAAS